MSLGTSLRSLREGRGLSIEELSERTHVSSHIIEDFEADKFDRITAAVYGSGFVKILAKAFGVDAEPLREMFRTQYQAWVDEAAANVLPKPPPKKFDERRLSERNNPPAPEAQKPSVAKPPAVKTPAKAAPRAADKAPPPAAKPAPTPAAKPAPEPAPIPPVAPAAAPAPTPPPAAKPAPVAVPPPAASPAPSPTAAPAPAPKPAPAMPSPLPDLPQVPEKPAEPERPPLVLDDSPPESKGVIDDLFSLKPPVIKPDENVRREPAPKAEKEPASPADDAPTFEDETPGKTREAIASTFSMVGKGFRALGAGIAAVFSTIGKGFRALGAGIAAFAAALRAFFVRLPLKTIGIVAAIAVAAAALSVLVRNNAAVDEPGETPDVAEVASTPEKADAPADKPADAPVADAPADEVPAVAEETEVPAVDAEPAAVVVINGSALTDNLMPPPDCYAE